MPLDAKPAKYAPRRPGDVSDLVADYPFGWIVGGGATALPFRPILDNAGQLTALHGHFARSNPQVARLQADPEALILILGPHGYISPSWMSDRTQAPTWNYAGAAFHCRIRFVDDPEETLELLGDLIAHMEEGRPNAWSLADMGPRATSLSRGIVAFKAEILEQQSAFKMGQDERDDVYRDIMRALTDGALLEAMKRQNPERL